MDEMTVELTDELRAAIEAEAKRRDVPVAQVVREVLEAHFARSQPGPRGLASIIGIGDSGDPEFASNAEEYLKRHWADDIAGDR